MFPSDRQITINTYAVTINAPWRDFGINQLYFGADGGCYFKLNSITRNSRKSEKRRYLWGETSDWGFSPPSLLISVPGRFLNFYVPGLKLGPQCVRQWLPLHLSGINLINETLRYNSHIYWIICCNIMFITNILNSLFQLLNQKILKIYKLVLWVFLMSISNMK